MTRPTVSVIIPTYNRADTLPRALNSVLAQTFTDWELVVVDDGSTDATPLLLEEYAKKLGDKLICVRQSNQGCSAARNRGIDASRGEWIAFLDSDDEFLPHKLERQMRLVAVCPDLTFVYSDYSFIDLKGKHAPSAITAKFPAARTVPMRSLGATGYEVGPQLFDVLLRGYFIATIVGLVRREALDTAIRFDERLSYSEEWLFYLQLARNGRAGFVDEPLAVHRFTPNSLSRTDKFRNMTRQCALFHAMKKQLLDLSIHQRRALDIHLARVHSQLAGSLRTAGHPFRALLSSARATYYGLRRPALPARTPKRNKVPAIPVR